MDNGPGVPAADRERVFLPLARAASSVDGSGIGLATCRRVAEAHGGTIGLAEAAGGGMVAWFELPE
jgi:signal transduction histidine kinase